MDSYYSIPEKLRVLIKLIQYKNRFYAILYFFLEDSEYLSKNIPLEYYHDANVRGQECYAFPVTNVRNYLTQYPFFLEDENYENLRN